MALSKKQSNRLGTILAVMTNETVPSNSVKDLVKDGFLEVHQSKVIITDKGLDEKNRLCTLAGLNIKYKSEKTTSS